MVIDIIFVSANIGHDGHQAQLLGRIKRKADHLLAQEYRQQRQGASGHRPHGGKNHDEGRTNRIEHAARPKAVGQHPTRKGADQGGHTKHCQQLYGAVDAT